MIIRASLLDLALCISEAADLVSPAVVDHHKRTAYVAGRIGRAMGLPSDSVGRVVLAASVHDVGALSLGERLRALEFDVRDVEHAEPGYLLLRAFDPFADIATIVRCHHVEWAGGSGRTHRGEPVPDESHVVFLGDRIAVLFDPDQEPLAQVSHIVAAIKDGRETRFMPEAVDAFIRVSREESFWFGLASVGSAFEQFRRSDPFMTQQVDVDIDQFGLMLAHIVDFRSHFTATHSSGVAASARVLAAHMGVSATECEMLSVAGHLHDLGKLAVPNEVLEKPAKLDEDERRIVRAHSYHTGRILGTIDEMGSIADWASHHHERLNGSGYPDHLTARDLSQGARIIAVSDVFTALSEDRPYRRGMGRSKALHSMDFMVREGHLDADVVAALHDGFFAINEVRDAVQQVARTQRLEIEAALAS